jgi:hypothetical protein
MPEIVEIVQPATVEVVYGPTQVVEVVREGQQGNRGPAGPQGPMGRDTSEVHVQTTPAATWVFAHNLGRPPATAVFGDSGRRYYPDEFSTATNVTLIFAMPRTGTVVLT